MFSLYNKRGVGRSKGGEQLQRQLEHFRGLQGCAGSGDSLGPPNNQKCMAAVSGRHPRGDQRGAETCSIRVAWQALKPGLHTLL
jgi:hypothetical protein